MNTETKGKKNRRNRHLINPPLINLKCDVECETQRTTLTVGDISAPK